MMGNFAFLIFVKHKNELYMFEVKLISIMKIITTFHLRMEIKSFKNMYVNLFELYQL